MYPEPGEDQDASIPTLGHSLHVLMGTYGFDFSPFVPDLEPPKTHNLILQNIAHCSPRLLDHFSLLGLDMLLYTTQTLFRNIQNTRL